MYRVQRVVVSNSRSIQSLAKQLCSGKFSTKGPNSIDQPATGTGTGEEVPTSSSSSSEAAPRFRDKATITERPDREISLLGPKDYRAPLPGNVGLSTYGTQPVIDKERVIEVFGLQEPSKVLTSCELSTERQLRVWDQACDLVDSEAVGMPVNNDLLECVAHKCPDLMSRDFQELFPNRSSSQALTVITVSQKTSHDMKAWTPEMEEEREELTENFVNLAQKLRQKLNEAGYWADFIDPCSGRPFIGPFTNATLFETDDRYRNFGFDIEDLGCCKVISHHVWGTKAFVGSLFTNASLDSEELEEILRAISG